MTKPVSRTYLWTDSTIALHWIKGSAKQWKLFVANRIIEIQSITDPKDWRHCPGKDNPDDLGTRGMAMECLKMEPLWWHGPEWFQNTDFAHDIPEEKVYIDKVN